MFKLDDKQKSAKEKVLQEIMDMMDGHSGSKLKDLKKPAVMEMSVSKLSPEDKADGGADDAEEGDDAGPMAGFGKSWDKPSADDEESEGAEPSDEEKAKITELYNRYCK